MQRVTGTAGLERLYSHEEKTELELPWVQLTLNELGYLARTYDLVANSRYSDIPSLTPDRPEIESVGKLFPYFWGWRKNTGMALTQMMLANVNNAIPLVRGFSEEYRLKFFDVGSLSNEDIDLAVSRGFLSPEYSGQLKLYERVTEFLTKMEQHPIDTVTRDSEIKQYRDNLVEEALGKDLIDKDCAEKLKDKGISSIRSFQNVVFVSKHES